MNTRKASGHPWPLACRASSRSTPNRMRGSRGSAFVWDAASFAVRESFRSTPKGLGPRMPAWISLDIQIQPQGENKLLIQLRRNTSDNRPTHREPALVPYDYRAIQSQAPDSTEYGTALG